MKLRKAQAKGAIALLLVLPVGAWAGGVVTNCTEVNLRAAMAGGGLVKFACDGTIALSGTITNDLDVTLDGTGSQVTISGAGSVRVFLVNTNVHFTAVSLAITNGTSRGGSAILNLGGTVNLTGVTLSGNRAWIGIDNYALSPQASGGAIFNRGGTVNATNCSFTGNRALTPYGSPDMGPADRLVHGGAIRNEAGWVALQACTFLGNQASGGAAYNPYPGDPAKGGAIHNSGTVTLDLCTFAGNSAAGGTGGGGGVGGTLQPGSAGGVPGADGAGGSAWGGTASSTSVNTLIASNTPAGDNTFSDPKLGPLADNGGPTLTMALLPGSPAIDAGSSSLAPATDQRGFPRPAGAAADIGAFEYGSLMPALTVSLSDPNSLYILASGNTGQACRLLASMDLSGWIPIATNHIGSNGTVLFYDTGTPSAACRFYRLVMP